MGVSFIHVSAERLWEVHTVLGKEGGRLVRELWVARELPLLAIMRMELRLPC